MSDKHLAGPGAHGVEPSDTAEPAAGSTASDQDTATPAANMKRESVRPEGIDVALDQAAQRFADRLGAALANALDEAMSGARIGFGDDVVAQGVDARALERSDVQAFRWRAQGGRRYLQAIERRDPIRPEDLLGIDRQRVAVEANTRQFVRGLPHNNVLLWGARGTGKSSLVKAMVTRYAANGLRLIELDAHELVDLPEVVAPLAPRDERYVLFVDDLSFEPGDPSYRSLKAALDGSAAIAPENVAIYATSNRRHLMPEQAVDNEHSRLVDGELHHGEAVEEKISLSERFGLWLAFHPFSQSLYLDTVDHWLDRLGVDDLDVAAREACRREALQWALRRGNRSGRVARQFALDFAGRRALESAD